MKRAFSEIISYLFILLFLYTSIEKFMEYGVFKEQIAMTPLLSTIAPLVALLIPIIEIGISVLLFWPAWRRKGLCGSLTIMMLFTVYIVYIINVDENLPCSCGGFIEAFSWKQHILFNCILIALAAISIYLLKKTKPTNNTTFIITN